MIKKLLSSDKPFHIILSSWKSTIARFCNPAIFCVIASSQTNNSTIQNTKLSGQPIICQLLSLIPKEIVAKSVEEFDSDKYYKTLTTYKQLVFMLYGVVSKANYLTSL